MRVRTSYFYGRNASFYQAGTMGAQLDIKSDDAYRLASQLAELTGESLTSVVTRALRSELDRERRERDIEAKVTRMLAAGKEIRAHPREPITSDHSCLYDEDGFPR
jgi:antitoxin VapB